MPFNCKWNNQLRTRQIKAQSTTVFSSQRQKGWGQDGSSLSTSNKYCHDSRWGRPVNKVLLWFRESSWICGYDYGPYTDNHWVLEDGDKASGAGGEGFRRICSCRAAAPGAGRCVCASPGEGCGCSGPRWEAAGGFAQTRSGQSFRKTPEDRATADMSWRTEDITDHLQSNTFFLE